MKREELAVYLATLEAVLDILNKMPNVTIKKVRMMIAEELLHVREQITKKSN